MGSFGGFCWDPVCDFESPGIFCKCIAILPDLSHEKNPGWLGYIGDDILPNYLVIIS